MGLPRLTNHPPKPAISIIGLGAVGGALARALSTAGYPLLTFLDRQLSTCDELRTVFPEVHAATDLNSIRAETEILLICVPDEQIAVVDRNLRKILPPMRLRVCAHTSGALPASVLKSVADLNIPIASIHPLQTFPRGGTTVRFRGIHFALEGDPAATGILEKMVADIGGKSFNIISEQKALYHAAAVFVSNFIPVLLRTGAELLASSGISEKEYFQMVAPLIRQSLENALKSGPVEALTGPLVRGDALTVAGHLKALQAESPGALALYRMLSLQALQLAVEKGLPNEQLDKLHRLLAES